MNAQDNVLITGITGFLGRHLTRKLLKLNVNVIGISHSEQKMTQFKLIFPTVKIFYGDINDLTVLDTIITSNKVNKIIHCAAMKNIWICQDNPTQCIETNILGSLNIIKLSKKHNIQDVIAISTDKANNPVCIYGMSKFFMEKMFLEHGYRIFQGVNLFWSDGSVLDLWYKNFCKQEPLLIYSDVVRHFCDVNLICDQIVTSKLSDRIIIPEVNYKTSITKLLKAFCNAFSYNNYHVNIKNYDYEKDKEDMLTVSHVEPTDDEMAKILSDTFFDTIFY